jgi:hypothetical protein
MSLRKHVLSYIKIIIATGLSASLFLVGCNSQHKKEEDCNFVQNVYGERVSWNGDLPVTIHIHQAFPQEYLPAVELAFKVWENKLGRPVFKLGNVGVPGPINPRQDRVNMIYWMDTWEIEKTSEQARTSIYWVGDQIKEADMRINAKNFKFYLDTPADTHEVHLASLIVHELGHVLGLKHNDKGGSVMATYLATNTERDQIGTPDIQSIRCEYQ